MKKILLVENNIDFAYALKWHFEKTKFNIITCTTGQEAIYLFNKNIPDLLLFDINLDGDLTGMDVAKEIRKIDKNIPIIFMSGENNSPNDVIEGFNIGCNFFLKKPLSIEEIETHINALLDTSAIKDTYKFNRCTFNPIEKSLFFNGNKESLSEKENQVLQILADHCTQVVELTDIMNTIWKDTLMEESLRNIVSSLRKKLKGKELEIETVKGVGYRLQETVIID
jgi:DNA-binding response OmpR family regulator